MAKKKQNLDLEELEDLFKEDLKKEKQTDPTDKRKTEPREETGEPSPTNKEKANNAEDAEDAEEEKEEKTEESSQDQGNQDNTQNDTAPENKADITNAISKLKKIQKKLEKENLERKDEIKGAILALLAQHHVLMIGPPGTSKTRIFRSILQSLELQVFDYTMSPHTTPNELFGSVPLEALKAGESLRNTKNKLPEANVALLDEVIRSKMGLLDNLLTVLNERIFNNNGTREAIPLYTVYGASNDFPDWSDDGELALYDRFILRYTVNRIKRKKSFESMLKNNTNGFQPPAKINLKELNAIQEEVKTVKIPNLLVTNLGEIRDDLKEEEVYPSDRKFKDGLSVVKANAALESRTVAELADLEVYRYILWDDPEDQTKVKNIVDKYSKDIIDTTINNSSNKIKEVTENAKQTKTSDAATEAFNKIKETKTEIDRLISERPDRKDDLSEVLKLADQKMQEIADEVLELKI